MNPVRVRSPYDWSAILRLLHAEFAYMDARIDPPSSLHRLTLADIAAKSESGEVWVIGAPAVACMFLTQQGDALYLGKLAVAQDHRGQGHARALVEVATHRARAMGLSAVTLETRVELVENHATFRALGFAETGRTAHPGFDHPTSVGFRRVV